MTLAVGTTLQHGTYIIDAWVTDDAIGPVYLAMYVPKGQWIQLRVLGSRSPELLPEAGDRLRFYDYLKQVNQLENPAFPALLGGFEEEGVCYQTLAVPPGISLDRWVTAMAPLSPHRSLGLVHQLIDRLESLRSLGWAGLRLTPDQVWYAEPHPGVFFTGFDLAVPQVPTTDGSRSASGPTEEAALVKGLSHLLYFLLTGQRAEATHAPLAVDLRQRYPALPTTLDKALDLGCSPSPGSSPVTLAEWKALLPAIADLPSDVPPETQSSHSSAHPTQVAAPVSVGNKAILHVPGSQPDSRSLPPATAPQPRSTSRSTPAVALVLTGLVATVTGLGLGLHARLQPASSAGQERLNPNQSFPPQSDWGGDRLWQPWDEAPSQRRRPNYGTTPPANSAPAIDLAPNPQEPAAPPPAVAQPEIATPEPVADPLDTWEPPVELSPLPDPGVAPAPSLPDPAPEPPVAPPQSPPAAPPPLEAPAPSSPPEVAPPAPLNIPPRPPAPAPSAS